MWTYSKTQFESIVSAEVRFKPLDANIAFVTCTVFYLMLDVFACYRIPSER